MISRIQILTTLTMLCIVSACNHKIKLPVSAKQQFIADSARLTASVNTIINSPNQWKECEEKDSVCRQFLDAEVAQKFPELTRQAFSNYFRCTNYSKPELIIRFSQLAQQTGNKKLLAYATYYEARSSKDLDSSIQKFLEAQKLFSETKDTNGLMLVTRWLGNIYEQAGQFDKGLQYAEKSFRLSTYTSDSIEKFVRLMELSTAYEYVNKYDSAIFYFEKGRPFSYLMPIGIIRAKCYLELVLFSARYNQNQDTLNYYTTLYLSNCVAEKDWANAIYTCASFASGLIKQKNYSKAQQYLNTGLMYIDSCPDCLKEHVDIYEQGYIYYDSIKNYPLAFNYLSLFNKFNEQYQIENKKTDMSKQQDRFEFKQQKQSMQLEQEHTNEQLKTQRKQKYYFIAGSVLLLLIVFLTFKNYRNQKAAKEKSNELLLNILPAEVAEELKQKGTADAKLFNDVTVLFTDFKSFTTFSEKLTPQQLVNELHECFSAFDHIMYKYGIEKIKTVGDAYLAVSGLPTANPNHAEDMVKAALEIQQFILTRESKAPFGGLGAVRIGIHSGSVVAGIVGVKKFAYDIWGDTVNTAARMEQNGEAGKVNISEATYELVKDKFACEFRGEIEAKNKGKLKMYFVEQSIL